MMFVIHRTPFPVINRSKYPFLTLEPGEWFKVTCTPQRRRKLQQALATNGRRLGRLHSMKFRTTCMDDGVAVQRIE